MRVKLLILILTASFFTISCSSWGGIRGSGEIFEEKRNIDEYSQIEISGAFAVKVFVGEEAALQISGDKNLLQYVVTQVKGDRLIISTKRNINPKNELRIITSTQNLEALFLSGANKVKVEGIDAEKFIAEISGACNVELDGIVEQLKINLSGASKINSEDLIAEDVKIDCSGASNALIHASNTLLANVSGVGKIDFKGDPQKVKSSVSGIGSINRK